MQEVVDVAVDFTHHEEREVGVAEEEGVVGVDDLPDAQGQGQVAAGDDVVKPGDDDGDDVGEDGVKEAFFGAEVVV